MVKLPNLMVKVGSTVILIAISIASYAQAPALQIRPFGDSITYGVGFNPPPKSIIDINGTTWYMSWPPYTYGGGYRGWMTYRALTQQNQLVFTTEGYRSDGSYVDQWATNTQSHDGYPGYRNDQLIAFSQLPSFADFTLIHSGSNDIFQGESAQSAARDLGQILNNLLTKSQKMTAIVAKIIGLNDINKKNKVIEQYNALIDDLAQKLNTQYNNRIVVVDMSTLLLPQDYSDDNIHPNATGYLKIACAWENAIQAHLNRTKTTCNTLTISTEEEFAWPQKNN